MSADPFDALRRRHKQRHNYRIEAADCWHCQRDVARCQSKRQFDEWDAINAAHAINVHEEWRRPMRAYWCRLCGHHHLTHAVTNRKRRRIERQGRRRLAREGATP